jgi:hypothetical protein
MSEDSAIRTWGTTEAERDAGYPCDEALPDATTVTYRGIDVEAPAQVVYRWLCQMQKGPYSYDLLDNFGRRSPRKLVEGLDQLELGLRFMTLYELVEFEPGHQLTVRTNRAKAAFGVQSVTYRATPAPGGGCRLVAKRRLVPPRGPFGPLMKLNLPWIDFVMARKQFKTLKKLSERTARGQG